MCVSLLALWTHSSQLDANCWLQKLVDLMMLFTEEHCIYWIKKYLGTVSIISSCNQEKTLKILRQKEEKGNVCKSSLFSEQQWHLLKLFCYYHLLGWTQWKIFAILKSEESNNITMSTLHRHVNQQLRRKALICWMAPSF